LSFNKADPHIVVPKKRASYSQVGPVPLPEVSAKGYEYFLNIPDRFLYVDVYRPVSSVRRDKVKVNLIPPTKVPSGGDIRPVVELVGKNGSKIPRIEGHSSGDLDLIIPLDVVITYGREKSVGAFREFEVSARAGSIVTLNDVRSESFERTFSVIKVRAYGDGVSQGITIGLDQVEPVRNPNAMGKKKEDISPLNAQVRISLQSERDLASIMSFIQAANKVGMVKGGPSDELGYFIVRRRSVVAQVGGRGLSKKILQLVTSSLQGDFVFKGYRRSLHDSGDKSQRDLALWIDSLLDQGKVLYVMKRDKLYPVSREFVKTNAEVARFIDSQAKALFVDKVDVISFR
jgi:hypothetical protein